MDDSAADLAELVDELAVTALEVEWLEQRLRDSRTATDPQALAHVYRASRTLGARLDRLSREVRWRQAAARLAEGRLAGGWLAADWRWN